MGALAVACGWGTVTVDDVVENHTGTAKHSDNLHCTPVILYNYRHCNLEFRTVDFAKKLMCGEAFHRGQKNYFGNSIEKFLRYKYNFVKTTWLEKINEIPDTQLKKASIMCILVSRYTVFWIQNTFWYVFPHV